MTDRNESPTRTPGEVLPLLTLEQLNSVAIVASHPDAVFDPALVLKLVSMAYAALKTQDHGEKALREALQMIAGDVRCPDNLLGNVDIARAALEKAPSQ